MHDEVRSNEELIAKIRSEFPGLAFTHAQLVTNKSDDHTVFILDNQWVFRFPRSESHTASFTYELDILKALRPLTSVPVPHYEYVSRNRDFGGYRIFDGTTLEPEVFKKLSQEAQDALAVNLGQLNAAMHSLPAALRPPVVGDDPETYPQFFARRRALIAVYSTELVLLLDDFFATYARIQPPVKKLVHGDLVGEHIYYDTKRERIVGIIDFSDAHPGDPAGDFTYFWTHGRSFVDKMYAAYSVTDDPKLIERSHWYFVRYQVSRLVDALLDEDKEATQYHTGLILEHLKEL
jgi:aminoglycoside 2''-phosphotransferase